MFFDSHCHLNSERLAPDFDAILSRAQAANVTHFLNVADMFEATQIALQQCEVANAKGFTMRATAGVHPQNAHEYANNADARALLEKLLKNQNVVAVGEIGLDYYYDETHPEYPGATRKVQQKVMREQIEIALEHNLPVVIHNRDSDDDLLKIVNDYGHLRGVFHCFGSSVEVAHRVLDFGFHLGFTGIITFKNAENVRDVARRCPLEKILIETDAPYLAPIPHRGKTNEPSFVPRVAETLAQLRGLSIEEIGVITTSNAKKLFDM